MKQIILYLVIFMAFATFLLLPRESNAVADSEQILPFMLIKLMPDWLAGILLAGAVAEMMSTADSQLLIATSSISEDVIHKALNRDVDDKTLVIDIYKVVYA